MKRNKNERSEDEAYHGKDDENVVGTKRAGDESADVDTEHDDDEGDEEEGREHTENHRQAGLGGVLRAVGDRGRHGGDGEGEVDVLDIVVVVVVNAVVDADQVLDSTTLQSWGQEKEQRSSKMFKGREWRSGGRNRDLYTRHGRERVRKVCVGKVTGLTGVR